MAARWMLLAWLPILVLKYLASYAYALASFILAALCSLFGLQAATKSRHLHPVSSPRLFTMSDTFPVSGRSLWAKFVGRPNDKYMWDD